MVWSYQQLRSFSAVARTGNMTEAAAQLGYTTGAVSQQIAALEASLTTQLFIRLPRGLSLTDAGELFLREVEQIIDAYHRAESALESPSPKHKITLRLGIFTSAAVAYLPSVLERLALTHPHIEVHSTETTIAGALPALTSGLIDASLTVRYPNIPMPLDSDVTATALLEEHFSILTGKLESSPKDDTKSLQRATPPATTTPPTNTMPFASTEPLTATEPPAATKQTANKPTTNKKSTRHDSTQHDSTKSSLAETPWILPPEETFFGRSVRQALHDAGITPVVNHSLENHVAAIALAQAGLGVTVVTPTTANLTANAGHLEAFPGSPSRIIEFQTLKSSSLRPSLIALQDVISKVVEEVSKC